MNSCPTDPSAYRCISASVAALWMIAAMPLAGWTAETPALRVHPPEIRLESPEASEQLLVFAQSADGSFTDVTRQSVVTASVSGVFEVSPSGRVVPLQDGRADVQVRFRDHTASIKVDVRGMASPPPVSFQRDVVPILSKAGCNSGGCHGKAEGQGGFKLSVFGYDAVADYQALISEGRGRRVFQATPQHSLLLRKATALTPHGGGRRIEPESRWYRLVLRWIREGAALEQQTEQPIAGITVEPAEITLPDRGSQQLRVTALDHNGVRRCVTGEADYQSNNEVIAGVDHDGLIAATDVPGEAAILVRYLGHVTVCRVTRPRSSGEFNRPPERNFIDRLVWDKLARLRVTPSPAADDATFLRRVYLDTIGTLPTPDEARRFLADAATDKRRRLIAELLERPEYADYWAQRWSDLLQIDKDTITPQSAVAMTRWVRGQVEHNVPYDQFVRSILTVQGSTLGESPAAFFQVQPDAEKSARAVSQLFLGVRIECAQCHHHPFERWDQKDYFALAGFFTGIERKGHPQGGMKIVVTAGNDLKHPRTGNTIPAAALGAQPAELTSGRDRRQVFAEWATSPQNPFFARTIANRLFAHYFGRGLVEPLDDLRATNPASNEPLLNALADHLIELRFDLKAFSQTLLNSQVYQLSSEVNESNHLDEQNYSHAAWKPLPAEVLLDAVSQATAVAEEFNGWPTGYRAIQVWDNKLPSHFLEVFGRPKRLTVCACERGTEPSIAQVLHLMNSPDTMRKIQDRTGRTARLASSDRAADGIIDELYLATLARFPSEAERQLMQQAFAESNNRREAAEDILWTLLNTKEFVFNR